MRPWLNIVEKLGVKIKLTELSEALSDLAEQLELAAERSKGLDQCYGRCNELMTTLTFFNQDKPSDSIILWADIRSTGFILHATPYEVSEYFQQWMEDKPAAWVFTSATLTVAGKFNNFSNQLGISEAETVIWPIK